MIRYLLFLVLTVGGGLAIGYATAPGVWYAGLEKPAFNPPDALFAPVWTVLYVLIALAGARLWRLAPSGTAMRLWWLQLALNFIWSPVFFVLHQVGLALAIIIALLATIIAFIAAAWRQDRPAALMFAPYLAWVAYASLLNGAILTLN